LVFLVSRPLWFSPSCTNILFNFTLPFINYPQQTFCSSYLLFFKHFLSFFLFLIQVFNLYQILFFLLIITGLIFGIKHRNLRYSNKQHILILLLLNVFIFGFWMEGISFILISLFLVFFLFWLITNLFIIVPFKLFLMLTFLLA